MRNSYLLIACLLLLTHQQTRAERIDTLLHFSCADLKVDTLTAPDGNTYTKLTYPGCGTGERYGAPQLPVKYIRFNVPFNASEFSVKIKSEDTHSLLTDFALYPIQRPTFDYGMWHDFSFISCDSVMYNTDAEYPTDRISIVENSTCKDSERQIVVAIYPVSYNPVERRILFSEHMNVSIDYSIISFSTENTIRRNSLSSESLGIPFYEYTIITNRVLQDSFKRIIAWKRQKGMDAGVVCVEDIVENLLIKGDTVSYPTGLSQNYLTDSAAKIRQYLQYAYSSGKTKYVLMGGVDSIVPIRYGTGENNIWTNGEEENMKIPSDHYYAELHSNWNKDKDDFWGEPSDGLNSGYQLIVGRLLCSTAEDVENYTDKLLRYELNPGNGNTSYLRSAFYQVANNWMYDSSLPNANGNLGRYVAQEAINFFPDTTIISEDPSAAWPLPASPTGNEIIAAMNNKNYAYVTWMGHGNPYGIAVSGYISRSSEKDLLWDITSKQNVVFPQMPRDTIIPETANGIDNLNNKHYPMVAYSHGCFNASFDTYSNFTGYPNMAQSFTQGKDYGGPAFIGHTRYSKIDSSYLIQKLFNDSLFFYTIGESLHRGKFRHISIWNKHYNILSTNLVGCPEIRVWTDTLRSFNASITYDQQQATITLGDYSTDTVHVGLRYLINLENEESVIDTTSYRTIPYYHSELTFNHPWNCLISLTARNYRPQILPLYLQGATLTGKHYYIVKDVICTSRIMEYTNPDEEGGVTFTNGSDYTFETKGTFKMEKDVVIERGARVCIKPSKIEF